jgi:polysaccharide export outer membrane protein
MEIARRQGSTKSKGALRPDALAMLVLGCCLSLSASIPPSTPQTPPQQTPPQTTPQQPPAAPPVTDSKQNAQPDAPKPDESKPDSKSDAKPDAKPEAKKEQDKKPSRGGNAPGSLFTTEMPKDLNDQPEFTIGPGDSLIINVWKEPEVSGGVLVRGDCRITLNLIKDVEVCDMTPTQIQALLTDKLSKFIAAPDVTVTLTGLQSRKIYFIGQGLKRQGGMVLNGPMTIAQALSDAGGLADFANDKKVIIQREENGQKHRINFNYREYLKGKNPQGNILLQPGDTIIVR